MRHTIAGPSTPGALALLGFLLVLAGCGEKGSPVEPPPVPGVCTVAANPSSDPADRVEVRASLESIFLSAAEEFEVPAALLKAIGYVETRWQMVEGHPEFGQPPAYGVMALRADVIARAAELAGVTVHDARYLPEANIRAAAALLASRATVEGVDRADLGAWAPVVGWYSGITLPEGRASYVHDDVYSVLRSGVRVEGVARVEAVAVAPHYPSFSVTASSSAVDYSGALWRPSPNVNARPSGDIGKVAMVIIHSCEGGYTGCWSWLANPASQVSAHYVVKEDGSEITQLVAEGTRAWHIGSTYSCQLNANFDCWRNGASNNHFTIGVEHGGYASQTVWPLAQIDASARLVCDVTRRHGIPRENIRILSHAQLQPHNRTDPGANWPWASYLDLIDSHCGDAKDDLIVDSDNAGADAERGYLSLSTAWSRTSASAGHWGSGYHFAPTSAIDDPAVFHFHLAESGTHRIEAWWTAGGNRSPSARFTVMAGSHSVATVEMNQQRDGSAWRTLGSWTFPAGWNSVRLSREGPAGCVVIADAIRIR
jgi:N-acetyl-anhydromuramyl-L-alanine amidase AmpD